MFKRGGPAVDGLQRLVLAGLIKFFHQSEVAEDWLEEYVEHKNFYDMQNKAILSQQRSKASFKESSLSKTDDIPSAPPLIRLPQI
jgi:hypothetical protein